MQSCQSHAREAAGPGVRHSALWLAGAAGALALAATATVRPDAASWAGVRGPHCPLGACLGAVACPGCGLVRSVAASVHGEFGAAFAFHPAGPVVAATLVGAALVHFDILRRRRELPGHRALRRVGHRLFAGSVLAAWLLRLLTT